MVQIKAIRRQCNLYALLLVFSIITAILYGVATKPEGVIIFAIIGIVLFVLLVLKNRLLYDATLIWDNRILVVPSVSISAADSAGQNHTEETVVSAFGVLIGARVYRWNTDGVHGVRLNGVGINRRDMILSFGSDTESLQIKLLHGITQKQAVTDAAQKLLHETGVTANIIEW